MLLEGDNFNSQILTIASDWISSIHLTNEDLSLTSWIETDQLDALSEEAHNLLDALRPPGTSDFAAQVNILKLI